ncbi:MAG: SIS domain-containing protein [Clostridia bacterium]|nr:SIS domain-containing protein [Clostridia bacterium]
MFRYFDVVKGLLDEVQSSERESMEQAADVIASSIADGRVLHYFAAGHSHMLGDELFYRAGGLAPVNVILEPALMVANGASKSSRMEQLPGLAQIILAESEVRSGDVMIISSNSGINPVPVEMAAAAMDMHVRVIAITSVASSRDIPIRNSLGKRLYELADVVIDTHVPYGDAAVAVDGLAQKIAPVSTAVGVVIINSIVVRVVEKLMERGIDPPIFASSNIPGGAEHNAAYLAKYKQLIKSL